MSMHLEGPWLSKIGKKRGKVKYKSAEAKRQAEELAKEWESLKNKYKSTTTVRSKPTVASTNAAKSLTNSDDSNKPKSLNSWVTGAVSSKPNQMYTGDMVKGITVMHKSCLQPVFTEQEAIDAAHMRR